MPPHATETEHDEPVRRRISKAPTANSNFTNRDNNTETDDIYSFDKQSKLDHFFWADKDEPHASRRREMLKKYPQIRQLMRHEPLTKYIVTLEVLVQFFFAWYLKDELFTWKFWLIAYFVGGTMTSSLVLSIHEITHFLAFKTFLPNKVLACIANLPIVLPFCVEFKVCHTSVVYLGRCMEVGDGKNTYQKKSKSTIRNCGSVDEG
jgi:sphingolipid delta-4 desaturase